MVRGACRPLRGSRRGIWCDGTEVAAMTTIGDHLYARSTHEELLARATNGAFVTTAMWYLLSTKRVDAVLGVEHDRERNLTHTRFIDDPQEIPELAGTVVTAPLNICLLYTSDAADDLLCVD